MEMKTKRNGNDERTVKSVVAVLQMIDLYQRKLKKAQSCHSRIAPWSKAIFPSSDVELVDGTLLVKGRSRDAGLLERFTLNSDNQPHLEGAAEKSPESSDPSAFSLRSRRCTKNVKYGTSEFDIDDEDNDSDFETSKAEGTSTRTAVAGWLASKFSSTKQKLSLSARKPRVVDILEETGGTRVKEPMENDDGSTSREGEVKALSSREIINEEKTDGREPDKNEKPSLKRRVMKAFGKKLKPKPTLEADSDMLVITSDQKEGAQDKAIASEPDDDQPKAPQRKRKKIEEPMFSCPMCGMKFIESEINQHAFTCNPEPKRESRSQARCSDNNADFIPLAINAGTMRASVSHASTSGLSANDRQFSEWKTACKKVSTGKEKFVGREVDELLDVDTGSSLKRLVYESARIDETLTSKSGNQKRAIDSGIYRKDAKSTLHSHPRRSKKPLLDSHRNWMSEDSDDANDLVDQYLDNKEKDNMKRKRWSRRKPSFIEQDSQDSNQKCFICSSTFYGESERDYEDHVKECIAKEEARLNGVGSEDASAWLSSQNISRDPKSKTPNENGNSTLRLNQRLGNRTSWTKFDKGVEISEDEESAADDVDVSSENDSPVKTFKPNSDSNLFNFENQFKKGVSRNGKKQIPKRLRKRRKIR